MKDKLRVAGVIDNYFCVKIYSREIHVLSDTEVLYLELFPLCRLKIFKIF